MASEGGLASMQLIHNIVINVKMVRDMSHHVRSHSDFPYLATEHCVRFCKHQFSVVFTKDCRYRIPLAANLAFIAESGAALGHVICDT